MVFRLVKTLQIVHAIVYHKICALFGRRGTSNSFTKKNKKIKKPNNVVWRYIRFYKFDDSSVTLATKGKRHDLHYNVYNLISLPELSIEWFLKFFFIIAIVFWSIKYIWMTLYPIRFPFSIYNSDLSVFFFFIKRARPYIRQESFKLLLQIPTSNYNITKSKPWKKSVRR